MRNLKTPLAYAGLYLISASDSVRYSIGWTAWGVLVIVLTGFALTGFLKSDWRATLRAVPWVLWVLFAWMLLSLSWSHYPIATLIGLLTVALATVFAFFLVANFSWRELLRLIANTMRFILVLSFLFELFAALVVKGPINPIFKEFQNGDGPGAYRWTQAHLFDGKRIQGIVGNANLLAYVAMLGLILFFVQYAIRQTSRALSLVSLALAVLALALTRSASVGLALASVALGMLVLLLAEGKNQFDRHRYYRVAYTIAGIVLFFVAIYNQQFFVLIGKTPDMTGRSELWELVLGLISQKPWLGWGWIGYWQPGVKPFDGLFVRGGVTYYQAHNIYLDFAVQIGIIGLLLLLAVMVTGFVKLWHLAVRSSNPLYSWPVMVFLALVMHNMLESRLIVEIGWVLFMITIIKVRKQTPLEPEPTVTKRQAVGIFASRLIGRGW
jgi:hypothetical protein